MSFPGNLVQDDVVIKILGRRISQPDCQTAGFVLDGFPRTVSQAQRFDSTLIELGARVTMVLALEVPEAELEERICGRWTHPASGRIYHAFRPGATPKSLLPGSKPCSDNMFDDLTGEALLQRPDDTPQALATRLRSYRAETLPVLNFYLQSAVDVRRVDARGTLEEAWPNVAKELGFRASPL